MWTVLCSCCCCCFLLVLLAAPAGGAEPASGYCLEHQCVSLFVDTPTDFADAKSQCERRNGHLMSMRSSAALDALRVHVLWRLENLPGPFWIGLHLAEGCPDPAAELRGYRWLAGDDSPHSKFSHWGEAFDGSCSAPRCVTVSVQDYYRWTQEPCAGRAFGFLCEHSHGDDKCARLDAVRGGSVAFMTPFGFGGPDLLSLPPGSTATRKPQGTAHICFSGRWLRAPWSCEVLEGGCEHKCASGPRLEPSCYCPEGRSIDPANNVTCREAQGPCAVLRCDHACHRDGDGSYACACDQGFRLAPDRRTCLDVNECSDERHCPAENSRCVNTAEGFECVCAPGFRAAGFRASAGSRCVDVDECASAPCEHSCVNTPGSYTCSCYDGYVEDPGAPNRCLLHCGAEECLAQCDPNDGSQCYCPRGYIAEERPAGTLCIDMDECSFNSCEHGCENTFGSYVCSCNPGFALVHGYKCEREAAGGRDPDEDGESEGGGSGEATLIPGILTASPGPGPGPGPTKRPSAVTVGGLVAILVCSVLAVALLVFLVYYFVGRTESATALKGAGEAHDLRRVTSDA